jgi:hypothetical protein
MAITFARLKDYLTGIGQQANLDPANARHGVFWNTDYLSFKNGVVPNKSCDNKPVPILNQADLKNSAFFLILQGGWCTNPPMPQMPKGGPDVKTMTLTLPDGTVIDGNQVLKDIGDWLSAGAPENG